jgi:hypothetical protein
MENNKISSVSVDGKEFAVRCFIDGERIFTDDMSKEQAECFLFAVKYLMEHLQDQLANKDEHKSTESSVNANTGWFMRKLASIAGGK